MTSKISDNSTYQSKMDAFKKQCIETRKLTASYRKGMEFGKKISEGLLQPTVLELYSALDKTKIVDRKCQEIMAAHIAYTVDILFPNQEGRGYVDIFKVEAEKLQSALLTYLRESFSINSLTRAQRRSTTNRKKIKKITLIVESYLVRWKDTVQATVTEKKREQVYKDDMLTEGHSRMHAFLYAIAKPILNPYFNSEEGAAVNFSTLVDRVIEKRKSSLFYRSTRIISIIKKTEDIREGSNYYTRILIMLNNIKGCVLGGEKAALLNMNKTLDTLYSLAARYENKKSDLQVLENIVSNLGDFSSMKGNFFPTYRKVNSYYSFWKKYSDDERLLSNILRVWKNPDF
jgi:hypothetical protein